MPQVVSSTSLTITNPLILYRALLATKRIEPDPSQYRLALHLQKLYHRLKDYEPEVDFRHRIAQISRISQQSPVPHNDTATPGHARASKTTKGIFGSLTATKEKRDALALTRRLTDHDSAIHVQSPQGLLLYGEVGTGKSLLVDLLADCLPNRKKRRWHFNTFMLDLFARLEHHRRRRSAVDRHPTPSEGLSEEHSLISIARDMISTSPILFLDEFQLPDRAASKILSNLLTSFFHLGGVLVATSNRMPEELANASGIEYSPPPPSRLGLWGDRWGVLGRKGHRSGRSESMFSGKGDFALFLDVLKARCEIWDMEGSKDWRRRESASEEEAETSGRSDGAHELSDEHFHGIEPMAAGNWGLGYEQSAHTPLTKDETKAQTSEPQAATPKHFFVRPSPEDMDAIARLESEWNHHEIRSVQHQRSSSPESPEWSNGIPWQSTTLRVYKRPFPILRHFNGATKWTFTELCSANLGPADYITLASTFHTVILTDVPILTLLQKNEARRLITLLDALYEARCKLLVSAEAGPDDIFFPEAARPVEGEDGIDGVYSETLAEIYQDTTSPFRPNISSYIDSQSSSSSSSSMSSPASPAYTSPSPSAYSSYQSTSSTPNYTPTTVSPRSSTRSMLADEDSDFGPVYGAGRSPRGVSDGAPGAGNEIGRARDTAGGPDFTQTGAYTGEDERFAYKRARSRLWEMCGARWWAREGDWWRPLSREQRPWEGSNHAGVIVDDDVRRERTATRSLAGEKAEETSGDVAGGDDQTLFRHNASPFRTSTEPPPKFSAVHAWGMMKWGKKAGVWGQGVDAVRRKGVGSDQRRS